MNNINKYKLEEEIRLSYYKHRGNLLAVSNDLNVPLAEVKRVGEKMQRRDRRDVSCVMARTLMEHIMLGHSQRIQHLIDLLHKIEKAELTIVSVCCKAPVESKLKYKKLEYTCLMCNKICKVKKPDFSEFTNIRFSVLRELRVEDKSLISFAEKMGYTEAIPAPVHNIQQNVLYVEKDRKLSSEGKALVEEVANLPPVDRERLRKSIEKRMNADIISEQ